MGSDNPVSSVGALELNSFHFLLIGAVSVVLMRAFTHGLVRALVLLAINGYFFCQFISTWEAAALFAGLVAFSYALGRSELARNRLPWYTPIVGVLALWAFLFLAKDPGLLPWINPLSAHPIRLIGISYMVFRCIQFVMDGEVLEDADFLSFVNFVLFFPTLLAGPIDQYERFQKFHQGEELELDESPLPSLHRIANGFIKKFVLYELLLSWSLFGKPAGADWPASLLWLGVLLLPVCLYLDFSGYCDMMLGLVRLMGYRLPENFDAPWKATNIQEFWNRWHITLSHFVRDYVFNPLSRQIYHGASPGWHFPLLMGLYFFTMILLGLWHGTTLAFLLFGIAHGVMLVLLQLKQRYSSSLPFVKGLADSRLALVLGWSGNYVFIALSMALWSLGAGGFWLLTRRLLGA